MNTLTKEINFPCILTIEIKRGKAIITCEPTEGDGEAFQMESTIKNDYNDDVTNDAYVTFNIGQLKFGGTDNFQYSKDNIQYPIYIDYRANSWTGDGLYVDNFKLQEYGEDINGNKVNWVRCEKIKDQNAIKYIALQDNPTGEQRIAYFNHSTTDIEILRGPHAGGDTLSNWWVTVIQEGNPFASGTIVPDTTPSAPTNNDTPTPSDDTTPSTSTDDYPSEINNTEYTPSNIDDEIDYSILEELVFGNNRFNDVLTRFGFNKITQSMNIYQYLKDIYVAADNEWKTNNIGLFSESTYPEIYTGTDYRGTNRTEEQTAYNALLSWALAMGLSELVLTNSTDNRTNAQTEIFKVAYDFSNGASTPLYSISNNGYHVHADPMIARLAASAIYTLKRREKTFNNMNTFRTEIKGSYIRIGTPFSNLDFTGSPIWDSINCTTSSEKRINQELTTKYNRRPGYEIKETVTRHVTNLGYAINTNLFIPNAPGPRVPDSNAYNLPAPYTQGQHISLFSTETLNYKMDEKIDEFIYQNYNMMDPNKINDWNTYSTEKKNRLIAAAATVPCTYRFMFMGEQPIIFNGLENYDYTNNVESYNYHVNYDVFSFKKGNDNKGLKLQGPFGMHDGICHYYDISNANINDYGSAKREVAGKKTLAEKYIESVTSVADNLRYPMYCEQYGRRRPGCGNNLNGHPTRVDEPAHYMNEIYNMDIVQMVADDRWGVNKSGRGHEDGLAGDSPTSYPSGHSAQIWALAMVLASINPTEITTYMKNAYMYSVNRTICRFHWNSDCIYGRLFGTMTLPIINGINIMEEGYNALYNAIKTGSTEHNSNQGSYIIENNNLSSNIMQFEFTNNTGVSLQLQNCVRFIYKDNNGNYYRTNKLIFDDMNDDLMINNIIISNGETKQFNIKLPVECIGCKFADKFIVNGEEYTSNILIYNSDGNSHIFSIPAVNSNETIKGQTTCRIIYGNSTNNIINYGNKEESYLAGTDNNLATGTIRVELTNNTGNPFTIKNYLRFILYKNGNYYRTDRLTFGNTTNTLTINNGETQQFILDIPNNYYNSQFSNVLTINGETYTSNILIYDTDGVSHTFALPMFDSNTYLNDRSVYKIIYGNNDNSQNTNYQTEGNDFDPNVASIITVYLKLTNSTGENITFDSTKNVSFALQAKMYWGKQIYYYGDDEYDKWNRVKSTMTPVNNDGYNIGIGQTKTFKVTVKSEAKIYLNHIAYSGEWGIGNRNPYPGPGDAYSNITPLNYSSGHKRNLIFYSGGNSDKYIMDNYLQSNMVYKNGQTINVNLIRSYD